MRHRSGQRKLNITNGAHRIAMLRNISNSLIEYEQIKTTLARAKELRRFVEPLITLGKKSSVANRRLAFSRLRHRQNVGKLFDDLGKRFAARPGGYVRVLKCGYRVGDNAPMALVELVELVERRQEEAAGAVAPALPQTDQPAAAEVSEAAVGAESAETVKTQAPAENDTAPAAEADESDKSK